MKEEKKLFCITQKHADAIDYEHLRDRFGKMAIAVTLDGCQWEDRDFKSVFNRRRRSHRIIATMQNFTVDQEETVRLLSRAIQAGTDYVEVSMAMDPAPRKWLISLALNYPCKLILSWTGLFTTPSEDRLKAMVRECLQLGADIVRISCYTSTPQEHERIMDLYKVFRPEQLVAYCLGPASEFSRWTAFMLGAPIIYVARSRASMLEPGELTLFDITPEEEIRFKGEVEIPSSIEFVQRAIFLASLCNGTTHIHDVTDCPALQTAFSLAGQLGAEVSMDKDVITVTGHQDIRRNGLVLKDERLDAGDSKVLLHLCLAFAGFAGRRITVTAKCGLQGCDYADLMEQLGLKLTFTGGRRQTVTVEGRLHGGAISIDGFGDLSLISELTTALALCDEPSRIEISPLRGSYTFENVSQTGNYFGLHEPQMTEGDTLSISIEGGQEPKACHGMTVPRDLEIATVWMAAGAVAGDITIKDFSRMNRGLTEEMLEIFDLLRVDYEILESGDINVRKSFIPIFSADLHRFPQLGAAFVLLAQGITGGNWIVEDYFPGESPVLENAMQHMHDLIDYLASHSDGNLFLKQVFPMGQYNPHGDGILALVMLLIQATRHHFVQIYGRTAITNRYPGCNETLRRLTGRKI